MLLTLLRSKEGSAITRVGGMPETRQFLEELGLVVGSPSLVIGGFDVNVICSIKNMLASISEEIVGARRL